jgi:hypothetical protein
MVRSEKVKMFEGMHGYPNGIHSEEIEKRHPIINFGRTIEDK